MRHNKKFNHLSRKKPHRKAMLENMASSLIINKRIKTTVAKAKALKMFVEPIITKSKEDSTHTRRIVFRYLQDKYATTELFREVANKIADRPGGYTRIIKLGHRLGDAAEMCMVELVDFNENMLKEAKETKKPKRRRRKKKTTEVKETSAEQIANTEEKPVEEKKVIESKTEEKPAEEKKVIKSKKKEKPAEEKKVIESKKEEKPVEEKKVIESKKEEKPAEEKKVIESKKEEKPAEEK